MTARQTEYAYLIKRAEKTGQHELAQQLREHAMLHDVELPRLQLPSESVTLDS